MWAVGERKKERKKDRLSMQIKILNTCLSILITIFSLFQTKFKSDDVQCFIHEMALEQERQSSGSDDTWLTDEHIVAMAMDLINTCMFIFISPLPVKLGRVTIGFLFHVFSVFLLKTFR